MGIASAPDPLTGPCYGSTFGSNFQHGSIYWTPRTGAHPVTGRIRDTWSTEGWENSPYGYPTTAEQHPGQNAPSHHRIQFFENGFLYWDGQYVTGEWRDPANPLITHPAY
ncbi:LGFP repeat-containing protein, partial [Parenemella sanctibonifatiensis]|uniref:LGFP repeat-containing protein n=1 Tax=Parenemella sanctibonifatiensis TaxID=2016505 RepID=UPI0039838D27